ncbi:MAG: TonB-dependent receptor [Pseudomonadota bacterium]
MKMLKRTLLCGATVSALSVAMAPTVWAQDDDEDVVVVTAQRVEQNLQEVPASVTNLSAAQLEDAQVLNVSDLQYQVPNISIAAGTGTANSARIFLRGVGEDESRGAVDPAVGVYVDGIYIGRQVGSLFDLVDLERIEVLRGPQGTLYGRNTNGGAIKLISKRPEMENSAEFRTIVGNEGRLDLRATGNFALGENTAVRATAFSRQRDGFWEFNPTGPVFEDNGGEFGELKVAAFRASLLHNFNDDWRILISADHTNDQSDPIPDSAAPPNDADNNVFTIEPLPGTTCAPGPQTFRPLGCFGDYDNSTESTGFSANVEGRFGNINFMSLTGYRQMEDDLVTRIGFPYFQQTDQDQFSQEFTLSSDNEGPLNWVTGFYYFQEDVLLETTFIFPFSVDVGTESYAVFAQGFYEVSEAGTLTFGARYTEEEKDLDAANLAFDLTRAESENFDDVSYTLKYDHQFNDDIMAYVSYSTGFKSGGWSPDCFGATACFQPVEEETLKSFEIGTRTEWLDGALTFNATYFNNQYEGLQIGATVPGLGFTRFNVDETSIQGLEFEWNFAVTEQFSIFGNLGILDAEYESVTESQAGGLTNSGASCPNGTVTVECALGLELKNAPEYKGLVGAAYEFAFAGGLVTIRGDLQFEDDSWSLVANGPEHALTDPGLLLNARARYEPLDGDWFVAVWGQNLTDEEYWRAASANSFTAYASPPITYGVEFGVEF